MYVIHGRANNQMLSEQEISLIKVEKFLQRELDYQKIPANDYSFNVTNLSIERKLESKKNLSGQDMNTQDIKLNQDLNEFEESNFAENQLDVALKSIQEAGRSAAILVFRLSKYKEIKKTNGSQISTALIRLVAARLREFLTTEAVFDQISEDEFAIVYEKQDASVNLGALSERLLKHCSGTYALCNLHIQVLAEIGIAQYPADAKDVTQLIQYARITLHQAVPSVRRNIIVA